MSTPDRKPSFPPLSEVHWFFVDRPRRNDKVPQAEWVINWINHLENSWPRLTILAYEALHQRSDAVLKPDLLSAETKDDKFRFIGLDIAAHIVTIGTQVDIRNVLNYFDVGQEVERTFSEKSSGQRAYRVSREGLFQIFIAVLGKLEVVPDTIWRKKKMKKLARRLARTKGSFELVTEIDRVIQSGGFITEPEIVSPESEKTVAVAEQAQPREQRMFIFNSAEGIQAEFRMRPPVIDPVTLEEIDRLMRKKPERGGPMMNVR